MKKIIIIFGFSGSGKSTIAKYLSKKLGLRLIHPSGILRAICLNKNIEEYKQISNHGFWEGKVGLNILRKRLNDDIPPDTLCDKIIMNEAKKGHVVIDSWSLPWLYNKACIKIYLKAPLNMRAERVSKRDKIDFQTSKKIISEKDSSTRKMYKKIGGFDMKLDVEVFDLILNTSFLNKKQVEDKIINFVQKNKYFS